VCEESVVLVLVWSVLYPNGILNLDGSGEGLEFCEIEIERVIARRKSGGMKKGPR
jgi:hypothetical protein